MIKVYKDDYGYWDISTDQQHILHRKGSMDYTEVRQLTTPTPEAWEEVAVSEIPPYTEYEYCKEVERLIALRYSAGKETEVNRERTDKPEQFAAYMDYVEQCKEQAKGNLSK